MNFLRRATTVLFSGGERIKRKNIHTTGTQIQKHHTILQQQQYKNYNNSKQIVIINKKMSMSTTTTTNSSSSSQDDGVIKQIIFDKITTDIKPVFLDVINESYMHNVPKNAETHFKIIVVSDEFQSKPLIKHHRRINSLLAEELSKPGGVHALSIKAMTIQQWEKMNHTVDDSPACMGGSKR